MLYILLSQSLFSVTKSIRYYTSLVMVIHWFLIFIEMTAILDFEAEFCISVTFHTFDYVVSEKIKLNGQMDIRTNARHILRHALSHLTTTKMLVVNNYYLFLCVGISVEISNMQIRRTSTNYSFL